MAIATTDEWLKSLRTGGSPSFDQSTFKTFGKYDTLNTKGTAVDVDKNFEPLKDTVDRILNRETVDLSDATESLKRIFRDVDKMENKDLKNQLKSAYKELHEGVVAHEKAITALSDRPLSKFIADAHKAFDGEIKHLTDQFKKVGVDGSGNLKGHITFKDGTSAIGKGTASSEFTRLTSDLKKAHTDHIVDLREAVGSQIREHKTAIDDIKNFARELERDTKISVKELLGKELGGVYKIEEVLDKAVNHSASSAEHAGEDLVKSERKFGAGAAIGAAVGAGAGYMMSGDDTKGQNTMLGGIVGALAGGAIQYWKSANAALGAIAHGRGAQHLLETGMRGASRL